MILVYTGNGKGKTSACVGQAVRALGQNMTVAFGQFMKRDGQAGEQRMLAQWLGPRFLAGGEGFLRREEDRRPIGPPLCACWPGRERACRRPICSSWTNASTPWTRAS